MVLIFSSSFEPSTNAVIEWLIHYRRDFIRVNPDDGRIADLRLIFRNNSDRNEVDYSFTYKDIFTVRLKDIKGYWFRRGHMPSYRARFSFKSLFKPRFVRLFQQQLSEEVEAINDYLFYLLRKAPRKLGDPKLCDVNKMIVLDLAASVGLVTPESYIVSNTRQIDHIRSTSGDVITKPFVGLMVQGDSERYFCYTELVKDEHLVNKEEELFPSLIQVKVDKLYEIRTFYLAGKFYSMAIFSQNDQQTQVDFRKYNNEKPNRSTPYFLPVEVEHKLKILMEKLGLETGSIDIIVTRDKQYVFLEVNPVGQFGMVSNPCNYHLEKKVAEYLIGK